MPWTSRDVEKHVKGLNDHQKTIWTKVANSVLDRCIKDGGTDKTCAGRAIRQATGVAQKAKEAERATEHVGALLVERGRVLSADSEKKIRGALAELQAVLAKLGADDPADDAGDAAEAAIEAARDLCEAELSHNDVAQALRAAVTAGTGDANRWVWVRDVFDDWFVYEDDAGDGTARSRLFKRTYVIADDGAVTLGDPTEVRVRTVYDPVGAAATEAADVEVAGDLVPLVEKAVRRDGTVPLKLIQAGWGSSGFYSADMLKRDGPKVFVKGLQMFVDHPSATEEADRPERSVRDIAAVLETDATWRDKGPAGPGLYADARVRSDFQGALDELAPHIGVSIRALGKSTDGEAEGRKGPVIESIVAARSVDFVTVPGAGGRVAELFESARARHAATPPVEESQVTDEEARALREANTAAVGRITQLEARLLEAEARELVRRELATAQLPAAALARLAPALALSPPLKEGALDAEALVTRIKEAIAAEQAYIASLGGSGAIRGMGAAAPVTERTPEQAAASLAESFQALGLSKDAAVLAASGRN